MGSRFFFLPQTEPQPHEHHKLPDLADRLSRQLSSAKSNLIKSPAQPIKLNAAPHTSDPVNSYETLPIHLALLPYVEDPTSRISTTQLPFHSIPLTIGPKNHL
ncbi:hypothetical protein MA16_Dca013426 [Dendrobium catenatum]|uniref:Uncharacterized protein n=1 Tax=Dendrobium catenatum TaxID=906689 RepID=A0A2I0X2T9_9ASPA|nr:hypothetical protein MA16_Dca013426 [Dendrobium catenatum]